MGILFQLIELHMASAAIDDHAIALGDLDHVVVHDSDSLLIAHAALIHKLGLLLRHGKAGDLSHVFTVTFHILNGDTRARAFRNRVAEAAQVKQVQVSQQDTSFWRTTDSVVGLLDLLLLNDFLFLACSGYRVEFGVKTAVRNSVVFDPNYELQVVVLYTRALNKDGATLDLDQTIILDVDFAGQTLDHRCEDVACFLVASLGLEHLLLTPRRILDSLIGLAAEVTTTIWRLSLV